MMLKVKDLNIEGYERVIEAIDPEAGLHSIIAIHNTSMGPSLGGTRIYPYRSVDEALSDALRLSKGMTYKSAVAEIGLGGGKSVIIADPKKDKTEKLLMAFADAVEVLKGKYICAEDVGTSTDDMMIIAQRTNFVAALPTEGSSGDPSPFTAWGVFRGMQAVALKLWNTVNLKGRTVAIQGLGNVGYRLAEFLFWHGAQLIVADVDPARVAAAVHNFNAKAVSPEEIYSVPCDIFAPCAMGGAINEHTIGQLKCRAVAGSANNQLQDPKQGQQLMQRGILYAPDFVINSGGIINASVEFEPNGYSPVIARNKVDHIFDTLMEIFNRSHLTRVPTSVVANELAEYKLTYGIGKRKQQLYFHNDGRKIA
jgi:leucine dehydrogenase